MVGDRSTSGKHVVDLARDIVRELPIPVLRRVPGEQDLHVVEALGIGRLVDELVIARRELLGGGVEIVRAKPARAVHHQPGVARDRRNDRSVTALGIRSVLLHRDAGGERRLSVGAGGSDKPRRVVRLLVEQQGIHAVVVVAAGEAAAVTGPDRLLVRRAEIGGPPRLAGGFERLGHLAG